MARFLGNTVNKGSGGSGMEATHDYDRATGITTNASNNVTAVTLGPRAYSSILYSNTGLVTSFVENINGVSKIYTLSYDANGTALSIVGDYL
jgi:hypothetical protein